MRGRAGVVAVVVSMGLGMVVSRLTIAYQGASHPGRGDRPLKIEIPQPLKQEHAELRTELAKATQAGGKTGAAAREVARIVYPHFVKEEAFALPPLGLLPELAQGKVTLGMRAVLPMTDQLQAELPQMLEEHQAVAAALRRLATAARAEQKPESARFAETLMRHAETEEQVTYPTAILIGRFLQLQLHSNPPRTTRSQ